VTSRPTHFRHLCPFAVAMAAVARGARTCGNGSAKSRAVLLIVVVECCAIGRFIRPASSLSMTGGLTRAAPRQWLQKAPTRTIAPVTDRTRRTNNPVDRARDRPAGLVAERPEDSCPCPRPRPSRSRCIAFKRERDAGGRSLCLNTRH